jgi:hypothetical protein
VRKNLSSHLKKKKFKWPLLLAAVKIPILGVDFLRHHRLLVSPAANCLVSAANAAVAAVVSTMLPPQQPLATNAVGLTTGPASARAASAGAASAGAASAGVASTRADSAGAVSARAAIAGAASAGPDSYSLQSSEQPAAVDMIQPFDVWLKDLLREFEDVVNTPKTLPPLPAANDVFHHIILDISSKFRRLDEEKLRAAKLEFEQLEKDGVVRRSDSPWASPLHMVQKADSSWRPFGDFRRLNLVTQPDSFTLPNMLAFANVAAGCKIFSKIDLRKGYHQFPMHPDNIIKTAITTPFGLFKYTRMLFGLRNASNMQHLPAQDGQGEEQAGLLLRLPR